MIAETEPKASSDWRFEELMRRRKARQSAGKSPKCGACLAPLDAAGVCQTCHPTKASELTPPAPEAAPAADGRRLTRPRPAKARLCVSCGGRVNTFNGQCPRCDARQPSAADLRPVRPAEAAAPQDLPAAEVPAEVPVEPEVLAEPAASRFTRNAGMPCKTCGVPTHPKNGRCYACRPGGFLPGTQRHRVPASSAAPAPAPASGGADPELAAIAAAMAALGPLDVESRDRAMRYLGTRFDLTVS